MKVEDNHYKYRIETKDSNDSVIDFVDIDTVEPLRCAYDVQDELNLETNEHIKRVEEIILNADSTEFWYVDEDRSTDTHLVCYFEEVQLMANADHPMVDTDRSLFEYGKINANEYQDTNFICTHVMPNGVSRIYMSIDKDQLLYQVFTNETIKEYIAQNPITIWYAIRYPVSIPRSMSKGHLLTLGRQTDVSISTNGKEVGLPLVKFSIGETEYNVDNKTLSIKNTTEGTQIRNIVLEGNTPINYARSNGVNTTEQVSNTRYDFAPFYDGQATIQGTVEGGYVSAKLYGDTMVNIAKPYGETPLLTATNASTLCDDLLGMNEEGIMLADGEITEGRIYGDSFHLDVTPTFKLGNLQEGDGNINLNNTSNMHTEFLKVPLRTFIFHTGRNYNKVAYYDANKEFISCPIISGDITSTPPSNAVYVRYGTFTTGSTTEDQFTWRYEDGTDVYGTIQSVVNPSVEFINANQDGLNLFDKNAYTPNVVNTNTGEVPEGTNIGYWTSDFIPVFSTNTYTWIPNRGDASEICFYDANKNFVEGKRDRGATYIPPQDGYVRFVFPKGVLDTLQFGILDTLDVDNYKPYVTSPSKFTSTHTLNKLPNGVADYVDVVNKVHVQRVGIQYIDGSKMNQLNDWRLMVENETTLDFRHGCMGVIGKNSGVGICDKMRYISDSNLLNEGVRVYHHTSASEWILIINKDKLADYTVNSFKQYMASNPITVLYELATPIYTPLTDEEIAQLPLSAYKDGYINLSSDQLTPSFEFRMRASNRYQVDMLETGYYYLDAPVGNVKLGTANADVQQMPCIVKVDNVGSGDSGYRLGFSGDTLFLSLDKSTTTLGYYYGVSGDLLASGRDCAYEEYIPILTGDSILINQLYQTTENPYSVSVVLYDSNKNMVKQLQLKKGSAQKIDVNNVAYFRFSCIHDRTVAESTTKVAEVYINPITLAKLPSHRIPKSFTQGMRCGTDFGYWEGIIGASASVLNTEVENMSLSILNSYKLNRIEHGGTIVEDEFDVATGKFTKRVGKTLIDERHTNNVVAWNNNTGDYCTFYIYIDKTSVGVKNSKASSIILNNILPSNTGGYLGTVNGINRIHSSGYIPFSLHKDVLGVSNVNNVAEVKEAAKLFIRNHPVIIYYELEVPEVTYLTPPKNQLKTKNGGTYTFLGCHSGTLRAQCKPSHLTYPVPSLVANREYTVVHNRKNINGSTKPITLDLGGTQVELNDTSSKTLVKTPSSLKHSSLIFIGGESTVDHVMVLDGDWTNKPIEYFENMMGHDTDAIITIIGNGQIDDVEEQYLW